MLRTQAFVIAVLMLTACGATEAPTPQLTPVVEAAEVTPAPEAAEQSQQKISEEHVTTIVMLGDSLTAGYALMPDQALPEIVERDLAGAGHKVFVINAGVSGDTTANGLARYDWSVKSAKPDILVVALGANDFLMGIPADIAAANLSFIIDKAKADGIKVVLAGLEPRFSQTTQYLQADYAGIYPELAKVYDVPFYEGFMRGVWSEPDLLQADGLHPTAEGVEVMAKRLSAFLESQLSHDH